MVDYLTFSLSMLGSIFITIILNIHLPHILEKYRTKENRIYEAKQKHFERIKSEVFKPLIEELVSYYIPRFEERTLDFWSTPMNIINNERAPIITDYLKLNNSHLRRDIKNHFVDLDRTLEELSERLNSYNELYTKLIKLIHKVVIDHTVKEDYIWVSISGIVYKVLDTENRFINDKFKELTEAKKTGAEGLKEAYEKNEMWNKIVTILEFIKKDKELQELINEIKSLSNVLKITSLHLKGRLNEYLEFSELPKECEFINVS